MMSTLSFFFDFIFTDFVCDVNRLMMTFPFLISSFDYVENVERIGKKQLGGIIAKNKKVRGRYKRLNLSSYFHFFFPYIFLFLFFLNFENKRDKKKKTSLYSQRESRIRLCAPLLNKKTEALK